MKKSIVKIFLIFLSFPILTYGTNTDDILEAIKLSLNTKDLKCISSSSEQQEGLMASFLDLRTMLGENIKLNIYYNKQPAIELQGVYTFVDSHLTKILITTNADHTIITGIEVTMTQRKRVGSKNIGTLIAPNFVDAYETKVTGNTDCK